MTKRPVAFKFSERMIEALEELIKPGYIRMTGSKSLNKTQWLEYLLADYLAQQLKGKVPDSQLDWCEEPEDIFKLFIAHTKAKRKEKGYGFNPDGTVFGPFVFELKKHYIEDE
jgi:hypothetical protein